MCPIDGSIIFTPDLFGPGITVNTVDWNMASIDAGIKHKGYSLEGEYYWRHLSNFTGSNTGGIAPIDDTGYQREAYDRLDTDAVAVRPVLNAQGTPIVIENSSSGPVPVWHDSQNVPSGVSVYW